MKLVAPVVRLPVAVVAFVFVVIIIVILGRVLVQPGPVSKAAAVALVAASSVPTAFCRRRGHSCFRDLFWSRAAVEPA